MKGMRCQVLRWRGYDYSLDVLSWNGIVTIMGTLGSHDQDIIDPLPSYMQVVDSHHGAGAAALDVRDVSLSGGDQRQVVVVPLAYHAGALVRDTRPYLAGGGFLLPGDSRMSAFLRDLAGYAYDPSVPIHDRLEK